MERKENVAENENKQKSQVNGLTQYMMNPKAFTIKKWLAPILRERFLRSENTIERLATAIVTDQDLKDFGRFVTDVFECAYLKAVEDYRSQFEKLGIKINVVPEIEVNQ